MNIDPAISRVTIITVTYDSLAVLPRMLGSIPAGTGVIVVDNGSSDRQGLREVTDACGARLVLNDTNRGFGTACNQGAELVGTEFLLFLNPDARIGADTLDALVAAADRHPAASAFNPAIRDEDDRLKIKRKSHLVPRRGWLARGEGRDEGELPFLHGSAMFVRRSAFLAVGGFDPRIFLFFEDDDLSLRLARQVGPLRLAPLATIRHAGAGSTPPGRAVRLFKAWHFGFSRYQTMRKHRMPAALATCLSSAAIKILRLRNLGDPDALRELGAFARGVLAARRGDDPFLRNRPGND